MQRYFNSILSAQGRPVRGALVTVRHLNGGLAQLYSNNGSATLANPVTTDSSGEFSFYAADGRYNLEISGPNITPRTIPDVLLEDPTDGNSSVSASRGYITAEEGQDIFFVPNYTMGVNELEIEINGVGQDNFAFTELTSVSIQTAEPLKAGMRLKVKKFTGATVTDSTPPTQTPDPTPTPAPSPAPSPSPSTTPASQVRPYGRPSSEFGAMTFREEFDGTSINSAKWTNHLWYEGYNGLDNIDVLNGELRMWPAEPFQKTNATLDTDGKFYQRYGYFEIEAALPRGQATWPAAWLYAHYEEDGQEMRPEIDIMEAYSGGGEESGWSDAELRPNNYGFTLHPKIEGDEPIYSTTLANFLPYTDLTTYNKYGVKWEEDGITPYFNGTPVGPKVMTTEYDVHMYFLLDLWLGSASGEPDENTITGPDNAYKVRYVRAWALSNGSTTVQTSLPTP